LLKKHIKYLIERNFKRREEMAEEKKGWLDWYFKSNLLVRILIGLILGAIVGLIFGPKILWINPLMISLFIY